MICSLDEPDRLATSSAFVLQFLDDADLDPLADSSAVVGAGVFFVGEGNKECFAALIQTTSATEWTS